MGTSLLTTTAFRELVALPPPVLDVVVPVHNEQAGLERSLRRLHAHLANSFPYSFRITVAENAGTDRSQRPGVAVTSAAQCRSRRGRTQMDGGSPARTAVSASGASRP